MGGSDPHNVTTVVMWALLKSGIEHLELKVVIGPSNPQAEQLDSLAERFSSCELLMSVNDMPSLMAWADVAITAGGSTCWELAFMGLPSLIVVMADNQRPVAEELDRHGAAVDLGWYADVSESRLVNALAWLLNDTQVRERMSHNGRELVDGMGALRVFNEMICYA